VGRIEDPDFAWYSLFYKIESINVLSRQVGSGFLLILIGSTIVVLTFILSIVSALAGGGKDKKEGGAKGGKAAQGGKGAAKAKGRRR